VGRKTGNFSEKTAHLVTITVVNEEKVLYNKVLSACQKLITGIH
jgi:hypothetical protein